MLYRTVGIKTFAEKLKFGVANRVDQFVEYTKQIGRTDMSMSSDDWTWEYIKWQKARKLLEEHLENEI